MKIAYFPNQTALNSTPVLESFLQSCQSQGWSTVQNSFDADAAVIWSVLWSGRMRANREVYYHYRSQNKPVFILEVGNLLRGTTWRVSLNHVNREGKFGVGDLDSSRPEKLKISLKDYKSNTNILIACQRQDSLQWQNRSSNWLDEIVKDIRKYTNRPIIVRPHPRYPIRIKNPEVEIELPRPLQGTYDDFDLDYSKYHCVINHNSGPSVQAAINGVHTVCDESSLAWPVSTAISNIENPPVKDRSQWFLELCHTEWTVNEIAQGIPLKRLKEVLFS